MKRNLSVLSQRYQDALRTHLDQGSQASLQSARGLGSEARVAGMQTLELAKLHEQTLVTELLPGCPARRRPAVIRQAGSFFVVAITPVEKTRRSAREAAVHLEKLIATLSLRTVELAASNVELKKEVAQRQAGEAALRQSVRQYAQLLEQSNRQQEQLKRLSRQILVAQENERKRISRELHDVIAQTLTGINVRLAALKKEAALNLKGLDRNIARTQRLVEKSVELVHQFARELRPAVLDDLGLIPALHSFMKDFTARTGVRTRLKAFAGVEQLNTDRRTVLFRVTQEALTNVARHAKASWVEVELQKFPRHVAMKIHDDGRSFDAEGVSNARGGKRLGLLGMRERLEMVGGSFKVDSAPGRGTTIEARIPLGKAANSV